MAALNVNGKSYTFEAEPDTPLLWVLREQHRADRHQIRLRRGAVRRLHGSYRWRGDAHLRAPGVDRQGDRQRS